MTDNADLGAARSALSQDIIVEVPSAPQPRDEVGQFASPEGGNGPAGDEISPEGSAPIEVPSESSGDASPEGDPQVPSETPPEEVITPEAEAGAEGDPTDPPAASAPEGTVEIEVPEGHWLREKGVESLPPMPAELEAAMRGLLKDPVRRAEVESAQQRTLNAEGEAAESQAAAEYYFGRAMELAKDPAVALNVANIREEHGDEAADVYLRGLFQKDAEALGTKLKDARQEVQHKSLDRQADRFIELASKDLFGRHPDLTQDQANSLLRGYGGLLDAGVYAGPQADTFRQYVDNTLGRNETPQGEPIDKEAMKNEIRAELKVEAEEAERQAAINRATNPLGSTPPANPDNGVVTDPSDRATTPNVQDIRANLRTSVVGAQP